MTTAQITLLAISAIAFMGIWIATLLSGNHTLDIKSKTVGSGQHGTARWASKQEIKQTYKHIPYNPKLWRQQKKENDIPQGIVVGCKTSHGKVTALVDIGDVHALMIGAAGIGKTAFFMFPNLEYACASGMSVLISDTKGDIYRQFAPVAQEKYGYEISILDLRNPARSDGFNMLYLINRYTDEYLKTGSLAAKAKAERYAKITAKTIISSDGAEHGANAYFYEAAEGLLTSVFLMIAEFSAPSKRHMFSAARSRRISIVAIIQSLAQLEKNYGKEGASIIWDNCQLTIFGGFAPNSDTANTLSKNLGERTVMSGYISKGKGEGSKSLQMMGRALMTPDELKSMPKGQFIVAKTGSYPMQSRLKLFTEWGITFDKEYRMLEAPPRKVEYADRLEIEATIIKRYPIPDLPVPPPQTEKLARTKKPIPAAKIEKGKFKEDAHAD